MERIYTNQFKWNYLRNKKFFQFFAPFLKPKSNFKHFDKKDDRHSLCALQIMDCEKRG